MKSTTKQNTTNGCEIGAKVGSTIYTGSRWFTLGACEIPEFADFRAVGCQVPFALNIHVTGRTIQRKGGDNVVKVKVEAVGDGEPSTFFDAWLFVAGAQIQ